MVRSESKIPDVGYEYTEHQDKFKNLKERSVFHFTPVFE